MTDLDAAIHAKLASWGDDPCGYATCVVVGWSEMRAALVAVLGRHKPQRLDDEHDPYCDECSSLAGVTVTYPCRTARDVATELGVEVDDA